MDNTDNIIEDCLEEEDKLSPDDLFTDFKELVKHFRISKAALLTRTVSYSTKETELGKTTDLFLSLTLDSNGHPFFNKDEIFIVKEIDFKESTIKTLINANKLRFALSERAYKDLKIDERRSLPRMVFFTKERCTN